MDMVKTSGRWLASLSDGRNVIETIPENGRLSPWQALLAEMRESGVKMTQLRLQVNGVTVVGARGADGYLQCTEARINLQTGKQTSIRGIGSVFGDRVYLTWVDDDHNVWQDCRPLADLKVHSTLA